MMDHMRGPEETALVARAMEPIVGEIVGDKEQQPRPPLITDFEDRESMDSTERRERQSLCRYSHEHIAYAHGETRSRVLRFVKIATHHRVADHLNSQQKQEGGNRELYQVRQCGRNLRLIV